MKGGKAQGILHLKTKFKISELDTFLFFIMKTQKTVFFYLKYRGEEERRGPPSAPLKKRKIFISMESSKICSFNQRNNVRF